MDDKLYAIRVTENGEFVGYVTEIGLAWYTLPLRNARLYRAKNFADIRCKRINKGWKEKNIKAEVVEIQLTPQRKDDE